MWTLFITLVICMVIGFVVGVGVLLVQDYPKLGDFLNKRPVVGWTLAGLLAGITVSLILYLLEVGALFAISALVK